MTLRLLTLAPALLLAACATPVPENKLCNADAVQDYVGKDADAATVEAARKEAGAGTARTLSPGQIVTMEYRADRLNLHVDGERRITRVACG